MTPLQTYFPIALVLLVAVLLAVVMLTLAGMLGPRRAIVLVPGIEVVAALVVVTGVVVLARLVVVVPGFVVVVVVGCTVEVELEDSCFGRPFTSLDFVFSLFEVSKAVMAT